MIKVINIHHGIPSDGRYFYIGRGSVFGNPFTHKTDGSTLATHVVGSRDEAIARYKEYMYEQYRSNHEYHSGIYEILSAMDVSEKVYLGCFCKPKSCHGDLIKEFVEALRMKKMVEMS